MKTQIATTPEQGKRLLACGVDPNTADMCYLYFSPDRGQISRKEYLRLYFETLTDCREELVPKDFVDCNYQDNDSPAWSLSALLALMPKDLMWQGLYYRLVMGPNEKGWEIEYNDLSVINNLHRVTADNPIEAVVLMIEWLTKEEYKLNEIKQ